MFIMLVLLTICHKNDVYLLYLYKQTTAVLLAYKCGGLMLCVFLRLSTEHLQWGKLMSVLFCVSVVIILISVCVLTPLQRGRQMFMYSTCEVFAVVSFEDVVVCFHWEHFISSEGVVVILVWTFHPSIILFLCH